MRRFRIIPFIMFSFGPSAGLFGGAGLVLVAWVLLSLLTTCTAQGQILEPRENRTASWYADNPEALDHVTRICRDDPGRLKDNPDCINAQRARFLVAERDAERFLRSRRPSRNVTPQTSPGYWQGRPQQLRQKLAICNSMPAEAQEAFSCAPARAAAARQGERRL